MIEEGQPFIEEKLRVILPRNISILGRLAGLSDDEKPVIPRTGELDPDNVRAALGLAPRKTALDLLAVGTVSGVAAFTEGKTGRPPQLCQGCPHADSYETINRVAAELDSRPDHPSVSVNSDIGCYSLGAGIGMTRGASDAGIPYVLAVIGESTFIHSGFTALIDAVEANTPMTVCILDNSTVAMTGCQTTAVPQTNRALYGAKMTSRPIFGGL